MYIEVSHIGQRYKKSETVVTVTERLMENLSLLYFGRCGITFCHFDNPEE
jgi:hypothetical protein